jgi:hypothetical protein
MDARQTSGRFQCALQLDRNARRLALVPDQIPASKSTFREQRLFSGRSICSPIRLASCRSQIRPGSCCSLRCLKLIYRIPALCRHRLAVTGQGLLPLVCVG